MNTNRINWDLGGSIINTTWPEGNLGRAQFTWIETNLISHTGVSLKPLPRSPNAPLTRHRLETGVGPMPIPLDWRWAESAPA